MKASRAARNSVFACLLGLSPIALADWYEIEVVVFARGAATGDERPDRASDFSYPADTRVLGSGPAVVSLTQPTTLAKRWLSVEELWGGTRHAALYDALLRNQAELFDRDALPPWISPEEDVSLASDADPEADIGADFALLEIQESAEPEPMRAPLAVERSYVALDSAQLSLRSEAQRLARSDHQILWHAAWRQNLPDRGRGAAIAVTGNAAPGSHLALQGVVRVSRTRFLHVDADLWLSVRSAPERASLTLPPPLPAGIDPAVVQSIQARFANAVIADQRGLYWGTETTAPSARQPPLAVHRLQEQRRARSEELHYLDHPQFGVLFIARPYRFSPWFSQESAE